MPCRPFALCRDSVILTVIPHERHVLRAVSASLILFASLSLAPGVVLAEQTGADDTSNASVTTGDPVHAGHFSDDGPATLPAPGGKVMQQGFTRTVTIPAPAPLADPIAPVPDEPAVAAIPENMQVEMPPARIDASHVMVQMAGQWASYEKDLWTWGRHTASSDMDLEQAMLAIGRYDGERLSRGWMATNALIAIQVKPFAAGVRKWEKDYGRESVLQKLHQNINYVTMIPGAEAAQNAILRASRSDSKQLTTMGFLYKDQAYSMQKYAWAGKVQRGKSMKLQAYRDAPKQPHPVALAELEQLAAPGRQSLSAPYDSESARTEFLSALKLGPRSAFASETDPLPPPPRVARGREATMTRTLGLAALMILGDEPTDPAFMQWSQDPSMDQCVTLSRVNMAQCLAAGHFVYETSFCIAQHQIIDMGKCLGKVSIPADASETN